MTFRDDDDDTSQGRQTQGGHKKRSGHAVWLLVLAAAIAIAAVVWFATPPGKPASSPDGTVSAPVPSRPVAPAGAAHVTPPLIH